MYMGKTVFIILYIFRSKTSRRSIWSKRQKRTHMNYSGTYCTYCDLYKGSSVENTALTVGGLAQGIKEKSGAAVTYRLKIRRG